MVVLKIIVICVVLIDVDEVDAAEDHCVVDDVEAEELFLLEDSRKALALDVLLSLLTFLQIVFVANYGKEAYGADGDVYR